MLVLGTLTHVTAEAPQVATTGIMLRVCHLPVGMKQFVHDSYMHASRSRHLQAGPMADNAHFVQKWLQNLVSVQPTEFHSSRSVAKHQGCADASQSVQMGWSIEIADACLDRSFLRA